MLIRTILLKVRFLGDGIRLSEMGSDFVAGGRASRDLSPCVSTAQWFEPHLGRCWVQAGWPSVLAGPFDA